jgi:hypothetical protein
MKKPRKVTSILGKKNLNLQQQENYKVVIQSNAVLIGMNRAIQYFPYWLCSHYWSTIFKETGKI